MKIKLNKQNNQDQFVVNYRCKPPKEDTQLKVKRENVVAVGREGGVFSKNAIYWLHFNYRNYIGFGQLLFSYTKGSKRKKKKKEGACLIWPFFSFLFFPWLLSEATIENQIYIIKKMQFFNLIHHHHLFLLALAYIGRPKCQKNFKKCLVYILINYN